MSRRALLVGLLVCSLSLRATAGSLDFDELPANNANEPGLSEEYAALGIHFHGSDDGSSGDGPSRGDPGAWGIEGVAGSAFVGFNGASYTLVATFDLPIRDVQLDVTNSLGALPGSRFILEGYRDGLLVGRHELVLGRPGEWLTASVAAEVDRLHFYGVGEGYHPFAIDDLRWEDVE